MCGAIDGGHLDIAKDVVDFIAAYDATSYWLGWAMNKLGDKQFTLCGTRPFAMVSLRGLSDIVGTLTTYSA